ncbi:MAG: VOC family protein [Aureispira sp.]
MKYVHTNIITDDWKRLAQFYIQAFACKMTLPQRNLSGAWLAKGTGVEQAEIKGAHLRLPGWSNQGPTLEIFQYANNKERQHPLANRKGLGHLAFEVADVDAALEKALAFGAQRYGEVASHVIDAVGTLTFVYLRDPDGNIVELQNWDKAEAQPLQELGQTVSAKHTTDDHPNPLKKQASQAPTEQETPSPKPISPPTAPSASILEEDSNIDPHTNKRAFLDALHKDVDQTNQSVRDAKAEIRASKEALRQQQQALRKDIPYTNEDRTIQKSKQELLQELKGEMEQEDLNQRALPISEQPQPVTEQKPTPPTTVEIPSVAIQLQVELKIGNAVEVLPIVEEQLSMATCQLARNLHLLTTVAHPQGAGLSFLEYLGKQYRADLVPLLKALQAKQSRTEQNNAWILLPRLKGSINHLLSQCEEQLAVIEQLGLEQLELSPPTFVATYENLTKIADLAEQKGATYLRLSYTAPATS